MLAVCPNCTSFQGKKFHRTKVLHGLMPSNRPFFFSHAERGPPPFRSNVGSFIFFSYLRTTRACSTDKLESPNPCIHLSCSPHLLTSRCPPPACLAVSSSHALRYFSLTPNPFPRRPHLLTSPPENTLFRTLSLLHSSRVVEIRSMCTVTPTPFTGPPRDHERVGGDPRDLDFATEARDTSLT